MASAAAEPRTRARDTTDEEIKNDSRDSTPYRKRSRSSSLDSHSKRQKPENSASPMQVAPVAPANPDDAPADSDTAEPLANEKKSNGENGSRINLHTDTSRASPPPTDTSKEPSRTRRKPDEGQRVKRLFGALLNLNTPHNDRKVRQRREIETRKKEELQRKDDEALEDEQRRIERVMKKRKEVQKEVDRENMRIRHRNILDTAYFLKTKAEPQLYYLPWTLRPDEDDRIDDQIDEAKAIIAKEKRAAESSLPDAPDEADLEAREARFAEKSLKAADDGDEVMKDVDEQGEIGRGRNGEESNVTKGDANMSDGHDGIPVDDDRDGPKADKGSDAQAQTQRTRSRSPLLRSEQQGEDDDDINHDGLEDAVIY